MGIVIRVKEDIQALIEKRLRYRFWDKERERSNRAAAMADRGPQRPLCPLQHNTLVYSGPPHDVVRRYVCAHCNADATEGAIKEMATHNAPASAPSGAASQ